MDPEKVFVVLDIGAYETTVIGVFRKEEDAVAAYKDNIEMGNDSLIDEQTLIN
jgi:hypothetical protein